MKIASVLTTVIIPVLLSAPDAHAEGIDGTIALITKIAEGELKDPYSAHISVDRIKDVSDTELAFCGRLNAKNEFGAYTGEKLFFGKVDLKSGRHTINIGNWNKKIFDQITGICMQMIPIDEVRNLMKKQSP